MRQELSATILTHKQNKCRNIFLILFFTFFDKVHKYSCVRYFWTFSLLFTWTVSLVGIIFLGGAWMMCEYWTYYWLTMCRCSAQESYSIFRLLWTEDSSKFQNQNLMKISNLIKSQLNLNEIFKKKWKVSFLEKWEKMSTFWFLGFWGKVKARSPVLSNRLTSALRSDSNETNETEFPCFWTKLWSFLWCAFALQATPRCLFQTFFSRPRPSYFFKLKRVSVSEFSEEFESDDISGELEQYFWENLKNSIFKIFIFSVFGFFQWKST